MGMKYVVLFGCVAAVASAAQLPWSKDSSHWSAADAQRVLNDSPWAQLANVAFPDIEAEEQREQPVGPVPDAPGMSGPNRATDGRWDGGVGKIPHGGTPTLPLTIRWDSALPVREAARLVNDKSAYTADQAEKDYILTVLGLVPGGRYRGAGQLPSQSRSDDGRDPQDPEPMLEGLMAQSRLLVPGEKPIRPENVKLDAATGALHLFFPRTQPIDLKAKFVMLVTRFGSMTIQKQFRLKDMLYQHKLEL